jgi:hypothetical protein
MLYLGEPLNLSASFAEELYAAASEYGEYADCFVAGASKPSPRTPRRSRRPDGSA